MEDLLIRLKVRLPDTKLSENQLTEYLRTIHDLLCLRLGASLVNIPNLEVWPNYDDLLEVCFNLIGLLPCL